MTLLTTRDRIRTAAERFRRQSAFSGGEPRWFTETKAALDALDLEAAAAEDVAAVLGNWTWTEIVCDNCSRATDRAVRVEEDVLCRDCLAEAVALLDAAD